MDLVEIVNGTTVSWVLVGISILVLFTFVKMVSAWRQTKRSPYFFLRQQAEKRLQAYFWATFGLLALAGGSVVFTGQSPSDATVRMAILAKAKPVDAASETSNDLPVLTFDSNSNSDSPESIQFSALSDSLEESEPITSSVNISSERGLPEGLSLAPELPEEFDEFEPTAELLPETEMTDLVFSTEINDDYEPISPRRTFGEGFFTIYATFDYDRMADGMEWAWIWRRNGEIVNGGNELWNYGDDGPGWIYYEPPEGFMPGEYTLEVWVNGELFQRGNLTIETEVANQ